MSNSGIGPAYPAPPLAGANAIGLYEIGVSSIGSLLIFDPEQPIISQYANSNACDSILYSIAAALDQTENFDDFYDHIWNVYTADGYGLDVWGRIVGVVRVLHIPIGGPYLGFAQANDPLHIQGWDQGIWFSGTGLTQNYRLNDDAYRLLVLAKAALNITDCSIPSINNILSILFPGRGDCYVTDGENMTMTYTFNFALSPVETAIVEQSGVLPRPAGVAATVVVNP